MPEIPLVALQRAVPQPRAPLAHPQIARTRKHPCSAGPNTASPASIAYCVRLAARLVRQAHLDGDTAACPRWHTYRSDTHTSGRAPSSTLSGSAFERLGRSTCSTAPAPRDTHSHHLRPCTRADVSSEHTTRLSPPHPLPKLASSLVPEPKRYAPAGTGSPAPLRCSPDRHTSRNNGCASARS